MDKCKVCGSSNIAHGYGLAYGGMGAYSYCDDCGALQHKHQEFNQEPPGPPEDFDKAGMGPRLPPLTFIFGDYMSTDPNFLNWWNSADGKEAINRAMENFILTSHIPDMKKAPKNQTDRLLALLRWAAMEGWDSRGESDAKRTPVLERCSICGAPR